MDAASSGSLDPAMKAEGANCVPSSSTPFKSLPWHDAHTARYVLAPETGSPGPVGCQGVMASVPSHTHAVRSRASKAPMTMSNLAVRSNPYSFLLLRPTGSIYADSVRSWSIMDGAEGASMISATFVSASAVIKACLAFVHG